MRSETLPDERPPRVPCASVAHAPKRSAIVAAHPSWKRGVRQPTPMRGGTWNAPPVPTSTVWLLVSFGPEWHVEQPTVLLSKSVLPLVAAAVSTHAGAGSDGTCWTQPVSAPIVGES